MRRFVGVVVGGVVAVLLKTHYVRFSRALIVHAVTRLVRASASTRLSDRTVCRRRALNS